MRKTIFFMSVFFLFMASSCKGFYQESVDISSEECITLELPMWPPEDGCQETYPPLCGWVISLESEYYSEDVFFGLETECERKCRSLSGDFSVYRSESSTTGTPQEAAGSGTVQMDSEGESVIGVSGNTVSVTVRKNKPFAITALPITKTKNGKSNFFKPAGFLYPYDLSSSDGKSMTWCQGFLATMMQNIFKNKDYNKAQLGEFISHFNWKKASGIIKEKTDNKEEAYNPWLLNQGRLIEKICSRNASSVYFNMAYTEEVGLEELMKRVNVVVGSNTVAGEGADGSVNTATGGDTAPGGDTVESGNSVAGEGADGSVNTATGGDTAPGGDTVESGNSAPSQTQSSPPLSLLSSFIPENDRLSSARKILLKKKEPILIYATENTGIMCTYSSIKKISLEYILLPIYIEGI